MKSRHDLNCFMNLTPQPASSSLIVLHMHTGLHLSAGSSYIRIDCSQGMTILLLRAGY